MLTSTIRASGLAALLFATVASGAHADPITVGSAVDHLDASHVFTCDSPAEVVQTSKHSGLVKGCSFLAPGPYGVVLALDKKTGVMKIDLVENEPEFGRVFGQAFTTVKGWQATKVDE